MEGEGGDETNTSRNQRQAFMRLHHELHILLASRLLCPRHFQYLLNHGSNGLTLYTTTRSDDIETIEYRKENYRKKEIKKSKNVTRSLLFDL